MSSQHERQIHLLAQCVLLVGWLSFRPLFGQVADPPTAKLENSTPGRQINRPLPKWLHLSGEFRARAEGRTPFGSRRGLEDAYTLTRLRVNFDLHPKGWLHAFVQGQDSRAVGIDPSGVNPALKNIFDLRQAYVDLKTGEDGWVRLRAGRQELSFGAQRMIGPSDWSNTARSFDALKATFGHAGARVDVFAASVVSIGMTRFDRRHPGQNLHGVYGSFSRWVRGATLEPYVFWKTLPRAVGKAGSMGDADILTLGLRWVGRLPSGFDYSTEMARQSGHYAGDHIAAWAGYWNAGYSVPKAALKPRLSLEYSYSSGDSGRQDGKLGTFDQLYPTIHSLNGIADLVGRRNLRQLRSGFEIRPVTKVSLNFDHHFLWLANTHDGLYDAAGQLVVAPPAGGSRHADVGREADVVLSYMPLPQVTVGAGFGYLFPGRFLKVNSRAIGTSFPYFSCTYQF